MRSEKMRWIFIPIDALMPYNRLLIEKSSFVATRSAVILLVSFPAVLLVHEMLRPFFQSLLLFPVVLAFVPQTGDRTKAQSRPANCLFSKEHDDVPQKQAFPAGTIVEFAEKKREHVGKILSVERKANGSARYDVEEFPSGKHFNIADKEVAFTIPAPNNPNQVDQILSKFEHAHEFDPEELTRELDISTELLEMAWEEAEAEISPNELIELIHSHQADHIEKYEAWRLLKSEIGHIFFKELKVNGRVVTFKPKPRSSVEASKDSFCKDRDDEFCGLGP